MEVEIRMPQPRWHLSANKPRSPGYGNGKESKLDASQPQLQRPRPVRVSSAGASEPIPMQPITTGATTRTNSTSSTSSSSSSSNANSNSSNGSSSSNNPDRRANGPAPPCVVKSLGSGRFAQQRQVSTIKKTPGVSSSSSPSSCLTSTLGACTGVAGDAHAWDEPFEEQQLVGCSPGPEERRRRLPVDEDDGDDDDDAVENLVVRLSLSKTDSPLAKSGTCGTVDTTNATDSVLVWNNATTGESFPGEESLPDRDRDCDPTTPPASAVSSRSRLSSYGRVFSSARKLLFGGNTEDEPCHGPSAPLHRQGEDCDDDDDNGLVPSGSKELNPNSLSRNYVRRSPITSSRSLMASSFTPTPCTPRELFAPAYKDATECNFERRNEGWPIHASARDDCASSLAHPGSDHDSDPVPTNATSIHASVMDDGASSLAHPDSDHDSDTVPTNVTSIHASVTDDGASSRTHPDSDPDSDTVPTNVTIRNELPSETAMGGHREIQYWRRRLQHAAQHCGKKHWSTADAYFNLGLAQMKLSGSNSNSNIHVNSNNNSNSNSKCIKVESLFSSGKKTARAKHQYDLAVENLTIAHGMFERHFGSKHLAVGRALDALALAVVRRANHERKTARTADLPSLREEFLRAQTLLEQAFELRVHHLGIWHVDTVETFNKLAGVMLRLGAVRAAANAYREVYEVRYAIYGPGHPSVAIAAHALANCCYWLGLRVDSECERQRKDALKWYGVALEVYEAMGLPYRHPTVGKLLADRSRLEDEDEDGPGRGGGTAGGGG
eukprot:jgi/Psemu1/38580/gm1.38580_g